MSSKCLSAASRSEIMLEENKKLAYCGVMRMIGSNVQYDDCMVVALYNAMVAVGKKAKYNKIYRASLDKGWYVPGQGFRCDRLDEAFSHFGLKAEITRPEDVRAKKIYNSVVEKKEVYIFFRPSTCGLPGHAMVATKGHYGVNVINPYLSDLGWEAVSYEIGCGIEHFAIKISRSA